MGGEKQAVLVYGPKKYYRFFELVELFGLVDKKEWVKNFMENESHCYESWDENDWSELVMNFLDKNKLSIAFADNYNWSEFCIGAIVDDYEQFMYPVKKMNNDNIKTVNDFCEKFKLPKPTFFAGIIGEFE